MSGCQDYTPEIPIRSYEELGLPSFATTRGVNIDFDLGQYGGNTAVQVYSENPYDADGNLRNNLKPVFAFFTQDGKYNQNVEFASVYDELYFACQGIGVPQLLRGEVIDGRVVFDGVGTRAVSYENNITVDDTEMGILTLDKYQISTPKTLNSRFGILAQSSGGDNYDYSTAFKNSIHALYPWSISGKPLAGTESSNLGSRPADYNTYEFYYDNDGNAHNTFGANLSCNKTFPKSVTLVPTDVDDPTKPNYYFNLGFKKGNGIEKWDDQANLAANYLSFNFNSAGTLTITRLEVPAANSEGKIPEVKTAISTANPINWITNTTNNKLHFCEGCHHEDLEASQQFTAEQMSNFRLVVRQSAITLSKITFAEDEGSIYEMTFGSNKTIIFKKDGEPCESFVSHVPANATFEVKYDKKTVDLPKTQSTKSPAGKLAYGFPLKDADQNTYVYTIVVPDNTTAELAMYFGDEDNAAVAIKKNGADVAVYCNKDAATCDKTNHIHDGKKGSAGARKIELAPGTYTLNQVTQTTLYYISLTEKKNHITQSTASQVYAYNNVYDENIKNLLSALKEDLWSGYGSKTARKQHFKDIAQKRKDGDTDGANAMLDQEKDFLNGEELAEKTYNKKYSQLEQGKKNNVTVTENGTEIWVTFLDEYNQFSCNTFGYYCYTQADYDNATDKAQFAARDMQKYIVFPNCSAPNYNTRSHGKYLIEGATNDIITALTPLSTGDKVQLLYYDGTSNIDGLPHGYTTQFPEGTIVGWFIIYNGFNGWDDKYNTLSDGKINVSTEIINNNPDKDQSIYKTRVYYSDQDFNAPGFGSDAGNGLIQRCVQISEPGGIAICFEDSYDATAGYDDMTYDDLIFAVTASAPLNNNSGHKGGSDTPQPIHFNEYGTYLFEDILNAASTDFDLNDVVVEYSRDYTLQTNATDQTVKLTKVVETYKIVNDGATYNDAFIIKTPFLTENVASINYTVTNANGVKKVDNQSMALDYRQFVQKKNLTQRSVCEPRLESDGGHLEIVLIDNINYAEIGSTYTFEINLTSGGLAAGESTDGLSWDKPANYQSANYDPYVVIIDGVDLGGSQRSEMHTPGKATTSYGQTMSGMNATLNSNYWSVAKVGNKYLPFALDIAGKVNFALCDEYMLISDVYSKFTSWAENNTTNRDWYNSPGSGTTDVRPTQPDAVEQ